MPPRSSIYALPEEVRADLDGELVRRGFGGYQQLTDWLLDKGYEISRSALHRYGSELEADFERTMGEVQRTSQMARAFAQGNTDERGAMVGATARIASESLLRITMALRSSEENPAELAKLMPNISRSLAELGRLTISQEKWSIELQQQAAAEARAKATAESAARAEQAAAKAGVSPEGIDALRAAIMGAL